MCNYAAGMHTADLVETVELHFPDFRWNTHAGSKMVAKAVLLELSQRYGTTFAIKFFEHFACKLVLFLLNPENESQIFWCETAMHYFPVFDMISRTKSSSILLIVWELGKLQRSIKAASLHMFQFNGELPTTKGIAD